jgi:Cdc6-like AAA superfamily ATPase
MNIVQNQRASYLNQAQNAARNLTHTLRALSPAQQAALLATIAAAAGTPVDITLTTGEYADALEAAALLDGHQLRGDTEYSWQISSGCVFTVDLLSREDVPHE